MQLCLVVGPIIHGYNIETILYNEYYYLKIYHKGYKIAI
jgi:hypothetical protein